MGIGLDTIKSLNFLGNPREYETMKIAAKARVEKYFTADVIYAALKNFYFELAGKILGKSRFARD